MRLLPPGWGEPSHYISCLEIFFDQVEIPERYTFSQHRFTPYDVAGDAIPNIVGQLSRQRTGYITGSIVERVGGGTATRTLLACIDGHHGQHWFTLIG